ncbi:hypothetical protein FACS1894120_4850 [Clostridia bacterium]|nr:hypothetical protein FACS1894120_4850 [Clostridia bacterium]
MNAEISLHTPNDGHRGIIFMVDDNLTQLKTGKNTLGVIYTVHTIPSVGRLFKLMETLLPDMIILDIEMPYMSGMDVLISLKSDPKTRRIPVIVYTARAEYELESLERGAADFVLKPCSPDVLLKRIEMRIDSKAR